MIKYLGSLSDPAFVSSSLTSHCDLARSLRCAYPLELHTSHKRRIETDVMRLYVLSSISLGYQAEHPCHPTTTHLATCVALHLCPHMITHHFVNVEWMVAE